MKGRRFSPLGYFMFFINTAVAVTCAVLVYSAIDNLSAAAIAAIMLAVVLLLAGLCTLVDYLRRRFIDGKITAEIAFATERISHGDYAVRLSPRHSYGNYDGYDIIMENLNSLASELSKTEMMNSDFISNVSHEIKTPLSVISSYAAALKNGGLDGAVREKYLSALMGASGRLSDLVVNVLKLNKLEHSSVTADVKEFDLAEQLRACILDFEEAIDKKDLKITCDIGELTLYSDESLLETVWHNLISNAVKFTPDGGRISVGLKSENGFAHVTVADTGCGIASGTGEHIFDKFYQGDTSHAQEGNGLGLAMVKRVIDILGGEISVSSKVGEGSAFTVKLKGLK